MSKGKFTAEVHCPNCGVAVAATISWYSFPGTRIDPPEQGIDLTVPDQCDECHVVFDGDVFEAMHTEAETFDWPGDDDEDLDTGDMPPNLDWLDDADLKMERYHDDLDDDRADRKYDTDWPGRGDD